MVYFCLLLTLLSALLSRSHLQTGTGTGTRFLSALIFLSFLICGLFLLSDYLTDDGINEAFIYHLSADKSGTGLGDFSGTIITSVVYLVIVAGISLFPLIPTSREPKRAQGKFKSALATLFVLIAIAFSPGTAGLYGLAEILILPNPLQDAPESYTEVEPDTEINVKKNLIYIYLESRANLFRSTGVPRSRTQFGVFRHACDPIYRYSRNLWNRLDHRGHGQLSVRHTIGNARRQ